MQAGIGEGGEAPAAVPNFTDTTSAVQVSQIVEA
jgi:hypothetical protein